MIVLSPTANSVKGVNTLSQWVRVARARYGMYSMKILPSLGRKCPGLRRWISYAMWTSILASAKFLPLLPTLSLGLLSDK